MAHSDLDQSFGPHLSDGLTAKSPRTLQIGGISTQARCLNRFLTTLAISPCCDAGNSEVLRGHVHEE
jgi:hypothetical protein